MTRRKPLEVVGSILDDTDDLKAADRAMEELAARTNVPPMPSIPRPVHQPEPTRSKSRLFSTPMPEYVIDALKLKAAQDRVTVRYIILKALQDSGVAAIDAADLVRDGRSLKSGRKT